MTNETLTAVTIIKASPEAIFAVLADPARHAAIDGTGWVQEPVDTKPIAASGQRFRMRMYHSNHPNGHYEMTNRVTVFDSPNAISWEPGYDPGDGTVRFGGWIWRYDLTALSAADTDVTLTYDWSGVPAETRRGGTFPPFAPDHLANSLTHLAELATS